MHDDGTACSSGHVVLASQDRGLTPAVSRTSMPSVIEVCGSSTLREPRARVVVAVDDGVLSRFEYDVEVPPVHRLLRPPAVDDAPLLADRADGLPVDAARRAVGVRLDERRTRCVQSSRGTSSARASGMRDHGATSTTVETPPAPTAAFTWRRPSRS